MKDVSVKSLNNLHCCDDIMMLSEEKCAGLLMACMLWLEKQLDLKLNVLIVMIMEYAKFPAALSECGLALVLMALHPLQCNGVSLHAQPQ